MGIVGVLSAQARHSAVRWRRRPGRRAGTRRHLDLNRAGTATLATPGSWNRTTWTQLNPAETAGARGYGSMTYDAALRKVVLFGGSDSNSDPATVEEWNGATWQSARSPTRSALAPARDRSISSLHPSQPRPQPPQPPRRIAPGPTSRLDSLAGPVDDVGHLLGLEGAHRVGADIPGRADLE